MIFIPSPNVAEDHQTKNAEAIVGKDAALLIKEKELDGEFRNQFSGLINDENRQEILGANILKLAKPNATQQIVDQIEQMLKKQ